MCPAGRPGRLAGCGTLESEGEALCGPSKTSRRARAAGAPRTGRPPPSSGSPSSSSRSRIGRAVGTVKLTDSEQATGETARAQAILADAGFKTPATENVLVESPTLTADSPAFRATVARRRGEAPHDAAGARTCARARRGQVSKDRHARARPVRHEGRRSTTPIERVQPVLDASPRCSARIPSFTVAEFGFASANKELNDTIGKDFQKAEQLSLPITFLILLFAFGAFVAAGVPVLLAFTAVLGSIGLARAGQPRLRTRPTRRSR